MPRKKRKLSSTGIYHVVIKGTNSQLLFEERKDYLKYIRYFGVSEITMRLQNLCLLPHV